MNTVFICIVLCRILRVATYGVNIDVYNSSFDENILLLVTLHIGPSKRSIYVGIILVICIFKCIHSYALSCYTAGWANFNFTEIATYYTNTINTKVTALKLVELHNYSMWQTNTNTLLNYRYQSVVCHTESS